MRPSPWHGRLVALSEQGLERRMRVMDSAPGPVVETPDGPKLCFCSNDYLGLAADPRLVEAVKRGADRWGAGAASSRLVAGNSAVHAELEGCLAAFAGTEAAVLFPSGYQANLGALTALTAEGDSIFSDELIHASLVDGCRLSRARVRIFRHRDTSHLEQLLREAGGPGLKLIVTDAVFSMDGDLAPLEEICRLADRHDARIFLDEAHALGVIGPGGRGLAAQLGLSDRVAVSSYTLGKALGVSEACVACDTTAARLLVSRARSLLYTTAAPAHLCEALLTALSLTEAADARRERLAANVALFRELAGRAGIPLADSTTPIQPVPVGDSHRVMRVSAGLWDDGVFVQGIRPPTVPEGAARLRVTLTAAHEPGHVERLVDALAHALFAPEGK
ncbi:MAG TPA: 8-amino-7-oxononanoate synthase [Polyangia bacterium]|nr:8-amino-7-oxononanoate synthase [Polyangia bacterium]